MRIFSFHRVAGPRARSLFIVLAGALLALVSADSLQAQFPGELRGRVLDAHTGEPLAGVQLELTAAGRHALTGADGSFHLRGLEPGEHTLRVGRLGYQAVEESVSVRNGAVTRLDFALVPRAIRLDELRVEGARTGGLLLDAEDIATSGAGSLGELLAELPGVTVRRRGPGGPEEVSIRGGGGGQLVVVLNGSVVNDPLTGAVDLSTIPLAGVTEVEVIPGAQAARYGPGALTGVVRVTATAGDGEPSDFALHLGSLGEAGFSARGEAEVGGIRLGASGSVRRMEGGFTFDRGEFLGGGEGTRRNAHLRQGGGRLELARTPREGGRLWLHLSGDGTERGVPGLMYAPSDSARQTVDRVAVGTGWERVHAAGRTRITLGRLRQAARSRDPLPPLGVAYDSRTSLDAWTGEGLWEGGRTGPLPVRPQVGVHLRRWDLRSNALGESGDGTRWDGGAHLALDSEPLPLPGDPTISLALRGHRDGATGEWYAAHDLALRVPLGPVRVHLAHRSAFSPPSAGDLFFREGVGIAPNPDLRGERVPSEREVGASVLLPLGAASLLLSGELFDADVRDMIVWAPDFRFVWSPRNVDVVRSGGEFRWELRHPVLDARFGGHLSRARVRYDRPGGSQVAYRPRDTGGLHLSLGGRPLSTSLRARYTGLRHTAPSRANSLDPFWTLDWTLSGEREVAGWTVRPLLRVDRLRNEDAPFIFGFPEPGRTLRLELRLTPAPAAR